MYTLIPQVLSTSPKNNATGIIASTTIMVRFDCDLHAQYTDNSIRVSKVITNESDNVSAEIINIPGTTTYRDRILTFIPIERLTAGALYQVTVISNMETNVGVRSVIGGFMLANYNFSFTIASAQIPPIKLLNPAHNAVIRQAPTLSWQNLSEAKYYHVQVSRTNTFNNIYWSIPLINSLTCSPVTPGTHYDPEKFFNEEGIYYWRVQGHGWQGQIGDFSEVSQFSIDFTQLAPIVPEDTVPEDIAYFQDLETDSEPYVLSVFPDKHFSGVALNLRTIYVRLEGEIDVTKLTRNSIEILGESIEDDSLSHGELRGSLEIFKMKDGTTIIAFTPEPLQTE